MKAKNIFCNLCKCCQSQITHKTNKRSLQRISIRQLNFPFVLHLFVSFIKNWPYISTRRPHGDWHSSIITINLWLSLEALTTLKHKPAFIQRFIGTFCIWIFSINLLSDTDCWRNTRQPIRQHDHLGVRRANDWYVWRNVLRAFSAAERLAWRLWSDWLALSVGGDVEAFGYEWCVLRVSTPIPMRGWYAVQQEKEEQKVEFRVRSSAMYCKDCNLCKLCNVL